MGFGLIFLGWSTFLFFKLIPPLRIVGCLLMLKGLYKLSDYGENFRRARNACAVFLGYFIAFNILWLLSILGIFDYTKIHTLVYFDEIIYRTILIVFSVYLYRALGDISKEVGFDKGIKRAKNCTSLIIVFLIFLAAQIVLSVMGAGKIEAYLHASLIIFETVWLFYSAMYIYSCYMMIATQEIIDDENKKMREYDEKYSFRTLKNKSKK